MRQGLKLLNTTRYYVTRVLKYTKLLLTNKKLSIKSVTNHTPILISGNQAKLSWEADNCYEIIVNDKAKFPGNTKSVIINNIAKKQIVQIKFRGINKQVIYELDITPNKVSIEDEFNIETKDLDFRIKPTNIINYKIKLPKQILAFNQLKTKGLHLHFKGNSFTPDNSQQI
jgi:flagellar biosynthesis component FlhA